MNRYQLAKIVDWAGTMHSRKRMQKMVFLLQAASCPLDADYDFHRYGPYSQDVARLTDEMTREGLLEEEVKSHPFGEQYSYSLPQKTKEQMTDYEGGAKGSKEARRMDQFAALARSMCETDPKELEVSTIIVFFRQRGHDWAEAIDETCRFKRLTELNALLGRADHLARRVLSFAQKSVSADSTTSHCQRGPV
jgi:uncharacterized protein